MISITETMANIRYLLDKHCKDLEDAGGAPIAPPKNRVNKYNKPIPFDKAVAIAHELDNGLDLDEAVIRFNYTKQTLWNIKARKNRFAAIPYENIRNNQQNSTIPISSSEANWQRC